MNGYKLLTFICKCKKSYAKIDLGSTSTIEDLRVMINLQNFVQGCSCQKQKSIQKNNRNSV